MRYLERGFRSAKTQLTPKRKRPPRRRARDTPIEVNTDDGEPPARPQPARFREALTNLSQEPRTSGRDATADAAIHKAERYRRVRATQIVASAIADFAPSLASRVAIRQAIDAAHEYDEALKTARLAVHRDPTQRNIILDSVDFLDAVDDAREHHDRLPDGAQKDDITPQLLRMNASMRDVWPAPSAFTPEWPTQSTTFAAIATDMTSETTLRSRRYGSI
ncbi:uncharacterized protein N7446_001360 [Penicillium canescens]|uniref:Uncharacterized protein n=1 Tax=Penicillium canescens TaxID=5083 RepID=A0AAD6N8S5_PENCN|nr:uncharacterized protein N7446_001360 [Penicillium canescens]KAJ6043164.1 hypothetical protein N7460_004519 [Penicillium canescens]KAJ6054639.1 hypothetical protein N7444_003737 [Penicillium canescens]KAJ6073583.1 hypothetical protein N7446_001360 [Penicillium canescens]